MRIIRVTTGLELTVHGFPTGSIRQQNKFLYGLIGNGCDIIEHVMPRRLYTDLQMNSSPSRIPGQCVSMLIDEEGALKENEPNLIGSYLYETDKHGYPIMGNILFVGEEWDSDGISFCGIEDSVFEVLEQQLSNMIYTMKAAKEEDIYGI